MNLNFLLRFQNLNYVFFTDFNLFLNFELKYYTILAMFFNNKLFLNYFTI